MIPSNFGNSVAGAEGGGGGVAGSSAACQISFYIAWNIAVYNDVVAGVKCLENKDGYASNCCRFASRNSCINTMTSKFIQYLVHAIGVLTQKKNRKSF